MKTITLLILLVISMPVIAEQACIQPPKDKNKTGFENASAYLDRILRVRENGVFVGFNKVSNHIVHSNFKTPLTCAPKELESFNLERNENYELLLVRLEYYIEVNNNKKLKVDIISAKTEACTTNNDFWNGGDDSFGLEAEEKAKACFEKKFEEINNTRQPNEFSDELFKRIQSLAKNGNVTAQYNMVPIQRFGMGTKINIASAYAWGLVATTVNPPFGKKAISTSDPQLLF